MTNARKVSKLTAQQYLAFEESASLKHEYVNGQLFAMTGGTKAHNIISSNILTLLRSHLRGKGCNVYMADVKVYIKSANCFYYPDVLVECGKLEQDSVFTETPVSIFEVLSKSTSSIDRREKLVAYQQIQSLKHYVIVHQTRRRLELYQRDGEDWTLQEIGGRDEFTLDICPEHPIKISMNQIYADLEFSEGPDLQVREDVEAYTW